MAITVNNKDLGMVTAYAYAVSKGYTGTEEEFAELMASYADVAEEAAASAAAAAGSASDAAGSASTATTKANAASASANDAAASASTASTKASEASASATSAEGNAFVASTKAGEAAASATAAAGSATTAGSKANEASESANNAATAKVAAQAAQTAAEAAQTAAETAQGEAEDAAASVSESAAQIATNTEDIADLKSAIDNVHSELMQPDFVDITIDLTTVGNGYYQSPIESGITSWHADSSTVTYSLSVKAGETYKITGYNYYQCYLYFARNPLAIPSVYKVFPNTTSTAILYTDIFTVEHDGTLYFGTQVSKIGVFSVKKQVYVRKGFALTDTISSTNLFDPATAVDGYYMGTRGNPSANSNSYYAYIPVQAGTYSFYVDKGLFGANADKIPLFSSNKTYMQQATAVLDTGDTRRTPATLTITQAMYEGGVRYVGWSGFLAYKHLNMFMVGDSYPSNFVPFFDAYSGIEGGIDYAQTLEDNAMFGKMVLFDGDSICNGSSSNDGSSGWASRIGDANSMGWINFGVGGATITYGISGVSHYLSTYIDTIHTYYPKLDYLILEGGTNDADHILTDASKIGTLDMTDFSGTYDNTTFCGALDTLFYKAITYYPAAKIGFIVAPKMASSDVTQIKDYGDNNNRYKFFKIAMTACEKWGIPYLNLWDGSHLNPSLSVMYDGTKTAQENRDAGSMYIDGQHLTAKGYNYISPIIEDWMRSL